MKRVFRRRMWLAGASLLAILLGSADANAITFGTGEYEFVVPTTGLYDFSLGGAEGGSGPAFSTGGGSGALIGGELVLAAGTSLDIIAGGLATPAYVEYFFSETGGGGGGGSFVIGSTPPYLLFAAGGGGGDGYVDHGFGSRRPGGPGIGGGGSPYGFVFGGGGGGRDYFPNLFSYPDYVRIEANAGEGVTLSWLGGSGLWLCGYGPRARCGIAGESGGFGGGGGAGLDGGGGGGGSPGGAGGSGGGGHGGYSYITKLARDAFGITGGNSGAGFVSIDFVEAVPEPSTWAMTLTGFGLLGGMLIRRGKKTNPA